MINRTKQEFLCIGNLIVNLPLLLFLKPNFLLLHFTKPAILPNAILPNAILPNTNLPNALWSFCSIIRLQSPLAVAITRMV